MENLSIKIKNQERADQFNIVNNEAISQIRDHLKNYRNEGRLNPEDFLRKIQSEIDRLDGKKEFIFDNY